MSTGTDAPSELVRTYRVRVASAAKRGVPSVGGDDLVERLSIERSLSVGIVHGAEYNFAVFLDGDASRCVAVWGITNRWTVA